MKCANQAVNKAECLCSYTSCDRRGLCCECVSYHRKKGEIPGCFFPKDAERQYNRSIEFFIKVMAEGRNG